MLPLLGGTVSMLGYMSPSTAPPQKKKPKQQKSIQYKSIYRSRKNLAEHRYKINANSLFFPVVCFTEQKQWVTDTSGW